MYLILFVDARTRVAENDRERLLRLDLSGIRSLNGLIDDASVPYAKVVITHRYMTFVRMFSP